MDRLIFCQSCIPLRCHIRFALQHWPACSCEHCLNLYFEIDSSSLSSPIANDGTHATLVRVFQFGKLSSLAHRAKQEGPPGYSPGVGKFDSDIFNGLDNLYPGGPFDPLGTELPFPMLTRLLGTSAPVLATVPPSGTRPGCSLCGVTSGLVIPRIIFQRDSTAFGILETFRAWSDDLTFEKLRTASRPVLPERTINALLCVMSSGCGGGEGNYTCI